MMHQFAYAAGSYTHLDVYKRQPMRFGELKKVLKPITNTALTNALKELESDNLVQRIQYNEMPLRVEYSLTCLLYTSRCV